MTERPAFELARKLAPRIATVQGIRAVSLGGSVARGTDDAASDVDLGLFYRRADPPDIGALRALAGDVDDRRSAELTELGGWGPRINGGGWLVVEGRRVDWLYREIEAVDDAIQGCRAGRSEPVHQPGHPWGWQPQILAGEVAYGISLADDPAELERLRGLALPYPEALREAKIVALWEAGFTLDGVDKAAARGDPVMVAAGLSRTAAVLVDAIFASGRRYLLNEKQVADVGSSVAAPDGMVARLRDVLGAPGRNREELMASVESMRELHRQLTEWLRSR